MRWPLRYQILLPMAALMLLSVVGVGGLGAWLAVRATKARIAAQIAGVADILEHSNFPLTDAVLKQMKSLSGADIVLVDDAGEVSASSGAAATFAPLLKTVQPSNRPRISLGDRLWVRNQGYFHTVLQTNGRRAIDRTSTLHILYPEAEYRRAWQHAVYPSLAFVVLALPIALLLATITAGRISRRMSRLQSQVNRIAEGDFREFALPERDDEIRALGQAVNRMAAMLARYEDDIRHTERMRTLAHLGGGIAHQIRNSATGCDIALDLHAQECSAAGSSETLEVAKRQLRLMEEYIQRFLQLGKPPQAEAVDTIDLANLVDDLLPLVQPAARHSGVDLQWKQISDAHTVVGNSAALSQLIINLLTNAIEAAAKGRTKSPKLPAQVIVGLSKLKPDLLALTISDSGPGPVDEVREQIFEPFVSEKQGGVGLGLSVAREVAEQHGGQLSWQRLDGMTRFTVELPAAHESMELRELQRA
jgi:signal transduction histidine kinase